MCCEDCQNWEKCKDWEKAQNELKNGSGRSCYLPDDDACPYNKSPLNVK